MITSEKVAFVLSKFEKVLPIAKENRQLSMREAVVCKKGDECGSTHCHGGWYVIANRERLPIGYLNYEDGAKLMAADLGFDNILLLNLWADNNPDIWGNRNGFDMFMFEGSFNPGEKIRAENLQDIYDHWAEVHDRLWLLENC